MSSNEKQNWSSEEKKVRSEFQPWILKLLPFSVAFLASVPYLVFTGRIDLAPTVKVEDLSDFSSKLEFTFRYHILGVVWMVFCMWSVIAKRFPSPAVNPTSGYEHLAEIPKNIMTNSLEQLIMTVLTQLSLLTYLDAEETKKVIPLLNFLFIIGRVTFWAGYPTYRSFGFWVTMWPMQIAMWVGLSKFILFATGCNCSWISWGIPLLFYTGFYIKLRIHRHKRF